MPILEDAFPHRDYDLPEGVERHIDAAPQSAYTDPNALTAELRAVFENDWVMVGRAGLIPDPGDYFCAMVGAKPVIVMRQQDGSISAMGNFCLHRYARLLEGSGTAKRIVCPYHHWTYQMNGDLIGVPDRMGFERTAIADRTLDRLACEVAFGFVYVSLRDDLPPMAERLSGLRPLIGNFGLEAYEDRHVVHEELWNGNWKLLIENFIESYHTTYTHPRSIGPSNPTHLAEFGPLGDPNFAIHSNSYRDEDVPEIFNPRLTEAEKRRFYVISLFPNGLAAVDANFVWWMALEPLGVGRTNARWGLSYAPETMAGHADAEAFCTAIREVIETATEEDKEMVERVQNGAAYGSHTTGLLHAPLEMNIREFNDYLARKIAEVTARTIHEVRPE
ncbi:MAG: aromatic ring-hydroxylating dioxygenase subunit alpha [Pseudomonadota bacterium]